MATIHRTVNSDHHYVSVRGPLESGDVRRLERACGPALECRRLRLTVDLDEASVSPPARAFLRCLVERGARLTGVGGESVLTGSGPPEV